MNSKWLVLICSLIFICVGALAVPVVPALVNFTTNPVAPNAFGWYNTNVSVHLSVDDNSEIRYCRQGVSAGTTESCVKLNPLWRYTTCVVKCSGDANYQWNKDNNIVKFIAKEPQDYAIFSADFIFSADANYYTQYFSVPFGMDVNSIDLSSAQKTFVALDKTAPGPQMFFSVAYEPDSYRGITMNTTPPWTIKSSRGLILAKLSLDGSGVDATSGIDYCRINQDYNADPNNWSANMSLAEAKYLSLRYTTTGEKIIAAFCKDRADNNKMWLSTSSPYKIMILDTNYPSASVSITADPNPINLDFNYVLTYTVPDGLALSTVVFDVNGVNYNFSVSAVKDANGIFSATITPEISRLIGLVHVTANVTDNGGYKEAFYNDFNSIETTGPLISSNADSNWRQNFNLVLTVTDPSGVSDVNYRINDSNWVVYDGNSIYINSDGNNLIEVRAADSLGNTSDANFYVLVDATKAHITENVVLITQTTATVVFTSTEWVEAVLSIDNNWDKFDTNLPKVFGSDGNWDLNGLNASTMYTYYILAKDHVGNTTERKVKFKTNDPPAPEPPQNNGGGGTTAGPAIIVTTDANETGPTNEGEVETTAPEEENLNVLGPSGNSVPSPASGAFTAGQNENNQPGILTGLFGLGLGNNWIWFLLLVPAAMWVYAAMRIRGQRLAATPTKKKK